MSISGPGATTSAAVSLSSSVGTSGSASVLSINTTDRTNWLCAIPNGVSVTIMIGTGCAGTTSTQLLNNQTYTGTVGVSVPTPANGTISGTINVNLQVGTSSTTGVIATPNQVNLTIQTGGVSPSQNVALTLNGAAVGVLSVSATTTTNQNWLLPSIGSSSVLVSVNSSGLSSGTYSGTVIVNTTAGTINVPVNLTVGGIPTLTVNPAQLNFAYQTGTATPLAQTISLSSNGTPVNVSVSSSTNSGGTQWLIVSPLGQLTTPTQITVSVQPAGLPVGATYAGSIQINSSGGATNGTVTIPVNLLVSANPIISANPSSLTFTAQAGGVAPTQTFTLASSGTPLSYTVTSSVSTPAGSNWLQVPFQSGTTNGTIPVSVNTSSLAVGTYTGSISVAAPNAGNSALTIAVTLNITSGPVLQLSVPSLSFAYEIGQQQPQSQTVTIGTASGQVNFTVSTQTSTGQAWLSATPTSGTAPGSIVVSAGTAGLAAGTYSGSVILTPVGSGNSPQTIQVTLVVSNTSLFLVSPNTITFTATAGSVSSSFQNVVITSTDGTALNFTVTSTTSSGSNWLLVSSTSGITPFNLNITANPTGLAVGTYTGTVTIAAAGAGASNIANSPQSLPVTLNIVSTNSLSVSPSSLSFSQAAGGVAPSPQIISVNSGGGAITFSTAVSLNQGQNWLTVSPSNATSPATLTVTANGAGLLAGTYTGQIVLASPGINQQVINVTLTVGSGSGGGLANGGSLAQIASGGGWTTIITLVNTGLSASQIQINFYDGNGNPLPLPLSFPQTSSSVNTPATNVVQTINPGATLILQTTGPATQQTQVGWAELLSSGGVSGFGVFQQLSPGSSLQEAVVPLETRNPNSFVLAYDNTNGYVTTAAIANISTQTANINTIIRDGTGAILQSTTITVPPLGHTDFSLPINFPVTSQRLGTVEFQTPAGGQISVLGLSFTPSAAFSTLPLLVK